MIYLGYRQCSPVKPKSGQNPDQHSIKFVNHFTYLYKSIKTVSKNYFSCPTASAALKNGRYWLALSLYFKSTLHRNVKGDSNRVQQMLSPHIGGNTRSHGAHELDSAGLGGLHCL